ncbi:MAG TPA: PP2C family protein-serine/threonine phosphatase [Thermoanaerobaculia bacterium]|nr:PP2C family protein-serine/threonine phosphatase [Thermoanaerobaculia bacterium]
MARARRKARKERVRGLADQTNGFLRNYTAGMSTRELRRLFERDAAKAYDVLTRGHEESKASGRGLHRLINGARLAFLGLSYKLTPARRALFALSLLAAVLSRTDFRFNVGQRAVQLDFSPLWFVASILGLCLLLALELVDRIQFRDELEVARDLQASLLPREMPDVPGYRFAHSYRTAQEVGGDYYDVCALPDGRLALLVCDATGHGMAAGLVMAIANATIGTALEIDPAPLAVAALLHRTLRRKRRRHTFLSLFYGLLTPETGRFEWVSAGHPFPYLRRADGRIEEIGAGSLPLGAVDRFSAPSGETTIEPGDLLVLYTDGLPEATTDDGATFGYERLAFLIEAGGTPEILHDRISGASAKHMGDEPIKDDLTLLVVGRAPELPPLPAGDGSADRTGEAAPQG